VRHPGRGGEVPHARRTLGEHPDDRREPRPVAGQAEVGQRTADVGIHLLEQRAQLGAEGTGGNEVGHGPNRNSTVGVPTVLS
jgi:hypothetical protein